MALRALTGLCDITSVWAQSMLPAPSETPYQQAQWPVALVPTVDSLRLWI